jgi:hypothetical protein
MPRGDNGEVTIDARVDELYQLPLGEFTAARNALAKSLSGAEAKPIKTLAKPTVVPWAINQLYWRERRTYERLMKAGAALRAAQIAALKGRASDLRAATDAHRAAIAEAVKSATSIAAQHGGHPAADQLARMLEALSLAANPPAPPGRLTDLVQPSGFEALAGVTPAAAVFKQRSSQAASSQTPATSNRSPATRSQPPVTSNQRPAGVDLKAIRAAERKRQAEERRRAREQAAAQARAQKAIDAAEREVERAREALAAAEKKLAAARSARLSLVPRP